MCGSGRVKDNNTVLFSWLAFQFTPPPPHSLVSTIQKTSKLERRKCYHSSLNNRPNWYCYCEMQLQGCVMRSVHPKSRGAVEVADCLHVATLQCTLLCLVVNGNTIDPTSGPELSCQCSITIQYTAPVNMAVIINRWPSYGSELMSSRHHMYHQ